MVMSTELSAYEDHCVIADGRALSGETRVLGLNKGDKSPA